MENKKATVVLWAHFRTSNAEHHKMEKFYEEKDAEDFYEWCIKQQDAIKNANKVQSIVITNCGVIR